MSCFGSVEATPAERAEIRVDDVIPDYGGRHETFTVADIDRPYHLVYRSPRGAAMVTWSITRREIAGGESPRTRVLLRLRMAPGRHVRLATPGGELIDLLTIAGMAAGLRERLADISLPGTSSEAPDR